MRREYPENKPDWARLKDWKKDVEASKKPTLGDAKKVVASAHQEILNEGTREGKKEDIRRATDNYEK